MVELENKPKKLLLHACCAPCGAYSGEFLQAQGYDVTYFFYNPNIFPKEEHDRRLEELKRYCKDNNFPFIVDAYESEYWEKLISGYELEPERGKRCYLCYQMRIEKTALLAKKLGFDLFTTTLSISPHKSYEYIKEISLALQETTGVFYLDVNLKKNDGYKKSVELSREYGFYRQDYCGCQYSVRKKN